jgi:hypothetical protein
MEAIGMPLFGVLEGDAVGAALAGAVQVSPDVLPQKPASWMFLIHEPESNSE